MCLKVFALLHKKSSLWITFDWIVLVWCVHVSLEKEPLISPPSAVRSEGGGADTPASHFHARRDPAWAAALQWKLQLHCLTGSIRLWRRKQSALSHCSCTYPVPELRAPPGLWRQREIHRSMAAAERPPRLLPGSALFLCHLAALLPWHWRWHFNPSA